MLSDNPDTAENKNADKQRNPGEVTYRVENLEDGRTVKARDEKGNPICGARSKRTGKPCRSKPMPNGRCYFHGGPSKGPLNPNPEQNRINRTTHGIYTAAILPHEVEIYESIKVGTLDDEIRILKLRLRRALIEQDRIEALRQEMAENKEFETSALELNEVKRTPDGKTTIKKLPDYRSIINVLAGRIGDLEAKRMLLKGDNDDDNANKSDDLNIGAILAKYRKPKKSETDD